MPVHHVELLAGGLVRLHGTPEATVGYHAPDGIVVGLLHHRPVLAGNGQGVVGHRLHAVAVEGDVEVVNLAVDAILLQAVTLEALNGPVGHTRNI